jgi:hypothetical protein
MRRGSPQRAARGDAAGLERQLARRTPFVRRGAERHLTRPYPDAVTPQGVHTVSGREVTTPGVRLPA